MSGVEVGFFSTGYGPLWAPAVSSWLRCVAHTSREFAVNQIGDVPGASVTDRMYTHTAENRCVETFLSFPSLTHLFFTEMDMILPRDAIIKLLAVDKDIVSGAYFLRGANPAERGQPCMYKRPAYTFPGQSKRNEEQNYGQFPVSIFPQNKPFRVNCSGLGCLLIKRSVFERLKFPWFDLAEGKYGSDLYFGKHVADAGIEWWVEPAVKCGQIDYYEVNFEDYKWQMENNPGFASRGWLIGEDGEGKHGAV